MPLVRATFALTFSASGFATLTVATVPELVMVYLDELIALFQIVPPITPIATTVSLTAEGSRASVSRTVMSASSMVWARPSCGLAVISMATTP